MKNFHIIALIFCLNIVNGLRCIFSIDNKTINANYPCSLIYDKYCYDLTYTYVFANGTIEYTSAKGCGNDLVHLSSFGVECSSNGKKDINKKGMKGKLECCDSDLCNKSSNYSVFGIWPFLIFVCLFFSSKNL
uniref:UPAR/Ly6 domain-containing protein n=1 Tax=Panagrolaimus sp. PS1159 TaxID=55785 RepID=A0AC35GVA2_9BILA